MPDRRHVQEPYRNQEPSVQLLVSYISTKKKDAARDI
jgi:hypothetical protein